MKTQVRVTAATFIALCGLTVQAAQLSISDERAAELAAMLPEPPAEGCPETRAELDLILHCQKKCSPQDFAQFGAEARLTPMTFQDAIGKWFTEEKLPRTTQLLKMVNREAKHCCDRAKQHFNRRRPRFLDSEIKPVFTGLDEPCYPSGHAVQATAIGLILAEIGPDHRAAIMERACAVGWNRIPAGVHYPSDCIVGRVLGAAVARCLLEDADFRVQLDEAKKEFKEARKDEHLPVATRWH